MGDRDSNNFLHILEAPGSIDQYKLFRLTGEERISTPFLFHLTLRSQGDIPPASAWINAPITFSLGTSDMAESRRINGRCKSFRHIHQKGSYVEFAIEVAPAFEALTLTRNRRIFTDKSARQVIATILGEHRIAFDDGKYGPSSTRPYIVQQDESDFALVSRLMEDEGVFYHFRFDEGAAPYKHRMFLAGDPSGYYDGDPFDLSFRRDHLLRGLRDLQMGYASTPAKVVTHDYDFAKPGDLSPVTAPSKLDWAAGSGQIYRYAEDYTDPGAGRDRAKLRIEGSESGAVTMQGSGSYVAFAPAARFQVDDPRLSPRERRIVVRSVSHDAFDPYGQDEGEPSYEQQFEAQPSAQTFRPERSTPRASSRGPQTAVVVDQNDPDGHGRVKVKFHWDVAGASTCWVRVLQQWAGNQMGAQFVPRPGMEVLVDFVEGRADRPVVVGCLYNGTNQHSYKVPANLTQAGFRTFGEGGLAHEFLFEDKGGAEEVYLRSGRDFRREVTKDEFAHVKGLQEVTVDTTSRLFAKKPILIESMEAVTLKVGASTIVISPEGVWIDAPTVNLNCGGPSFPVAAVSPPAKAAATAAMALSGGAAAAPGGGGPGAGGNKVATGDPVMALSGGGAGSAGAGGAGGASASGVGAGGAGAPAAAGGEDARWATPPISPQEKAFDEANQREAYWESRMKRGDPIGETAIGIVRNDTAMGQFSNWRLKNFIKRADGWDMPEAVADAKVEKIGRELMHAHTDLIERGVTPTPSLVSRYHHDVFVANGLPKRTFGGTAVTGTEWESDMYEQIWMNEAR